MKLILTLTFEKADKSLYWFSSSSNNLTLLNAEHFAQSLKCQRVQVIHLTHLEPPKTLIHLHLNLRVEVRGTFDIQQVFLHKSQTHDD